MSLAMHFVASLARNRRGVAAVEMAFILPVLVLLILGVAEVGMQILTNQRLNATAARLGDLVAQETKLDQAKVASLLAAVEHMTGHKDMGPDGVVIVSGIGGQANGGRQILWQQRGAGTLDAASRIGSTGQSADLGPDFAIPEGQVAIAVEVLHRQGGLLGSGDDQAVVSNTTFHRGRTSELTSIAP